MHNVILMYCAWIVPLSVQDACGDVAQISQPKARALCVFESVLQESGNTVLQLLDCSCQARPICHGMHLKPSLRQIGARAQTKPQFCQSAVSRAAGMMVS